MIVLGICLSKLVVWWCGGMNILEEVLSACVSSARAEPMVLVEYGGKKYHLHTQLHAMITMPSGSFKSTILKSIPEKSYIDVQDYSLASFIGSIGERGLVKGYVMKAAGKSLAIDEFHSLGERARKALLSITEDQRSTRLFGYSSYMKEKKSGKYLKYRILDNEIHIDYVRTSILLSGIVSPHKERFAGIDDFAFSSRFIPVTMKPDFTEIDDMLKGKISSLGIRYNPYDEAPIFEDWMKFVDSYTGVIKSMPPKISDFFLTNTEFFVRQKLQFARFLAWVNRKNSTIVDWQKYVSYIPYFVYSAVTTTLSFNEFVIYNKLCEGLKQVDIANNLNVSEAYVSKIVNRLRDIGLVDNKGVCNPIFSGS
jgi:hypothetical protein